MRFRENVEVTCLPNGVRVVSETIDHVQSVAVGLWVGAGAREEDAAHLGITHFIEHMLFKGTARRDAREIADEIESRGGSLNAFTEREYTVYYAKALAEHAGIVMDVLTDMLRGSVLADEEVEREKNVVVEEIKRYEDTPDDLVHDLFAQTLWPSHPLGRPIIGTRHTVQSLTHDDLAAYMATHYTPDRVIVAAAGNVAHSALVRWAEEMLGDMQGSPHRRIERKLNPAHKERLKPKKTEQVHFCMGSQGYGQLDDRRYPLSILDAVVGGNMTSRLFQEIRERRGLAYAIGSYSVSYREGGYFTIYGGTSPDTYQEVLDLTRAELDRVVADGLTADEVAKTKTQMRGSVVLGLESMSARMLRMGRSMLYHDRVIPLDDILDRIEAVTLDDIAATAREVIASDRMALAAIGPFPRRAREAKA